MIFLFSLHFPAFSNILPWGDLIRVTFKVSII